MTSDIRYIVHKDKNGTTSRIITHANLEKLVYEISLSYESFVDASIYGIVLLTYPSFTNSEFLQTCIISSCLKSFIRAWIEEYSYEFNTPPEFKLLKELKQFFKSIDIDFYDYLKNIYLTWLHQAKHDSGIAKIDAVNIKKPIKFQHSVNSNELYTLFKTYIFAEQITYIDFIDKGLLYTLGETVILPAISVAVSSLMNKNPTEFTRQIPLSNSSVARPGHFWNTKNKQINSPTVHRIITQSNSLIFRVLHDILYSTNRNTSNYASKIEYWILTCNHLRDLKNYISLKSVLSALRSVAIYRLRSVWNLISGALIKNFSEHSQLFKMNQMNKESREILVTEADGYTCFNSKNINKCRYKNSINKKHTRKFGLIPCIGLFLNDLIKIDMEHTTSNKNIINVEKKRIEYEILANLKLMQNNKYNVTCIQNFQDFYDNMQQCSVDEAYQMSLKIEPLTPKIGYGTADRIHVMKYQDDAISNTFYENNIINIPQLNSKIIRKYEIARVKYYLRPKVNGLIYKSIVVLIIHYYNQGQIGHTDTTIDVIVRILTKFNKCGNSTKCYKLYQLINGHGNHLTLYMYYT
ncbi:hypothetical protein A3Q56_06232 [Intoshia linei]|uniref:Ras-GEF domain-containing protein n=1 Tax=Intoshia linei TaxID=1819745 RepID=A0A177AXZ1_9BILA|nr:hypothetical protein A3Q56_06232 [Intoshia linei]